MILKSLLNTMSKSLSCIFFPPFKARVSLSDYAVHRKHSTASHSGGFHSVLLHNKNSNAGVNKHTLQRYYVPLDSPETARSPSLLN